MSAVFSRLRPASGWMSVWLVLGICWLAARSTEQANWSDDLQILPIITVLGVTASLILAALSIPEWLAWLGNLAIGAVVIAWQLVGVLPDSIGGDRAKLAFLWERWSEWAYAVRSGGQAQDFYLFLALMAVLHYLIGAFPAWLVFRRQHAWLSVVVPGIVLLTNLGFARQVSLALLIFYLFFAMILVGRVHFALRELRWQRLGIPYTPSLIWQALWTLSYVALGVLVVGWIVPFTTRNDGMTSLWQRANGPWLEARNTLARWFPSVRGPGGAFGVGGFASFSTSFDVGGPLQLSNDPVLVVRGDVAPYLVAQRYSTFTGRTWIADVAPESRTSVSNPPAAAVQSSTASSANTTPMVDLPANQSLPQSAWVDQARQSHTFRIEILSPRGPVFFTSGALVSLDQPSRVEVSWFGYNRMVIDVQHASAASVSPILWPLIQLLQQADFTPPPATPTPQATPSGEQPSPTPSTTESQSLTLALPAQWDAIAQQVQQLRNQGIRVHLFIGPVNQQYRARYVTVSGTLPDYNDVTAAFVQDTMKKGTQYTVTARFSTATPDQLRKAGEAAPVQEPNPSAAWLPPRYPCASGIPNCLASLISESTTFVPGDQGVIVTDWGIYPESIYQRYTQLPSVVSDRTRQLAQSLAAGKTNAYDVAVTIEQYLRQHITYNENVPAPPTDDVVDYVLFQRPEGYCTYYASAMVELLRILGIPSRLVTGYYPGDFEPQVNGFLYRDRNAHAWVEVFFPGYGWITFEPTAARAIVGRGEFNAPNSVNGSDILSGTSGTTSALDKRRSDLNDPFAPEGAGAVGSIPDQNAAARSRVSLMLSGIVLAFLLLVSCFAIAWSWGTRGLRPAARFMLKVQRAARWTGIPWRASLTPYEFARLLGRVFPEARYAARLLADLYTREQYGKHTLSAEELQQAQHAWTVLRACFLRRVLYFWRRNRQTVWEPQRI